MRILLGFSHLSPWGKSARAAASPSAELPREVSSWTPAAYDAPSDSDEWVQFLDVGGLYFWNKRTRETAREPLAGVNVVWVGTMDEEGGLLLLAQGNACQYI